MKPTLKIRPFTHRPYLDCLAKMQAFTKSRGPRTGDEIWLIEHEPVFTLGLAGKTEHLLNPGNIPVVKTERGGQVTYHGPGQVLAYLLLDIRRRGITIKDLVYRMEQVVIDLLAASQIGAERKAGAPGVYISTRAGPAGAKIASLGLKISRGCTFHGLALNVNMELEPFSRINPCGFAGLPVVDMRTLIGEQDLAQVATGLGQHLARSIESDQQTDQSTDQSTDQT